MIARLLAASAASIAIVVALAACGGSPGVTPVGTPAVTLELAATNSQFSQSSLTVPANSTFAVDFTNNDSVPHNVSIQGGPAGMTGEIFGGPAERTYVFAGLPPGSYTFICDVHPDMKGTLTVN